MTMVYVAAPYSNIVNKPALMRSIAKFCGEYMIAHPGEYAITGLVHHYACEDNPTLGTDYQFWETFCQGFIQRCDKVVVLKIDGWETSKGVAAEIDYATHLGRPVEFVDWSID